MKIKAKKIGNEIRFTNFVVRKESSHFFGVYEEYYQRQGKGNENALITSGTTLQDACKKAKLLQIGYNLGRRDERDTWIDS